MAYRKLKAGRIFTGTQVLDDLVLITTEGGTIIDLVETREAGDGIEQLDGLLVPGFINAHCHTELSHMKGTIPKHGGMVPFLMQVMFERQAQEPIKLQAIQTAIDEMYLNGIEAVGDICNTIDSIYIKSGATHLHFHNFIESSGFVPATAKIRIEQAIETANKFTSYFPPQQVSITPHAAYSVSQKLFNQIVDQSPSILSIHNQESQSEEDFIRNKSGELLKLFEAIGVNIDFFEAQHSSSLQYMLPMVPVDSQVILVHNCFTNQTDIQQILKHKAISNAAIFLCLCPNANLYIGTPLPQLSILIKSGLPICIGTDSLASNDQLSILEEIKTLQQHFPFVPLASLLQWATLNGAMALNIESRYGSFKKGKKPGILLLEKVSGDQLGHCVTRRIL